MKLIIKIALGHQPRGHSRRLLASGLVESVLDDHLAA